MQKTKKELRSISISLRTTKDVILFNAIIKKTNVDVKKQNQSNYTSTCKKVIRLTKITIILCWHQN